MSGNQQIPALQDVYLLSLCGMFNDEKLTAMLQDFGGDKGRLWLTRDGSTVPEAHVDFVFERDAVLLRIVTRNEREQDFKVAYAEGLDGAAESMLKVLRAGRIADKRGARAA